MGKAMFYHLTRRPMEDTLMMLLGKATGAGWRVVVRGTRPDRMALLDEKLWQGADDSFLPHGLAGGAHDARQPILLSTTLDIPNAATCVMSVDGADVAADEVAQLDRVCVLFDGNDPQALDIARGQWSTLKKAGAAAEYWSEESGSWQKKAETKAG
ncbi:DNA polymerase III subunit chi [Roseobacter sp. OBYS 0001]|uniref:DNA polymerase III subunit chi n=1 Tax=Roseobacter sp. OBYS 0001 TaxID=882651 RepID=UPI001BBA086B|nr:DNA polymerase III subunit chi [Roseobacter sp. OBYS 0001]GIT87245.1 DNA polymerase III subunit chi [Roseobacter sp. OBYS 0001]